MGLVLMGRAMLSKSLIQLSVDGWGCVLSLLFEKWKSESESLSPTLCGPMDCSPLGSPVHGILQARILEWVAISFSSGSSQTRDQTQVTHIAGRLSHQGSLPLGKPSLLFSWGQTMVEVMKIIVTSFKRRPL